MNTKNNLRFQESEIRLENAMLELMKDMDLEKISVKKICELADVNRSTFYAHFHDIYDMLSKMESHLQQELTDSLPDSMSPEDMMFSEQPLFFFLRHIRRHSPFYRIALKTRTEFPIKQGLEPLWNQVIKPRCENAGITAESEMMYYFVYFQAGFTMILKRWVDTGCKETEQQIAGMLMQCIPAVLR